ncbi:MAG TPA: hypothetical protein VEY93_13085, partial [Longimicrobium sp.]|nr:hypothetical protein [Longimicrobium sp.]
MIQHRFAPALAALVGLATGLAISNAAGERSILSSVPTVSELTPTLPADPMPAFSNARMALAVREAQGLVDGGR